MKKLLLFLFLLPLTGLLAQTATCPNCTQPGTNLVTNGDFGSGNTGFTSNLTYAPTGSSNPGKYAIRANANNYWVGGCSTPDHTAGGATNLLCIDAKTTGISIAWAQTIGGLQQNKDYILTFYTKFAVCSASPGVPSVKVLINAAQVGDTILIRNGPWRKCTYKWNSGGSTSAVIQIIDTVPGGNGNDFVLDDLAFAKCDTNTFVSAGPDNEVCTGSPLQLNSTGTGAGTCSWSGPSGLNNYNICNPILTPATSGYYTFAVNYTLSGCTVTDTVTIHANPLPATPTVYQSGDTLYSTSAYSYQWYSTSGLIPGATNSYFSPSSAGNYHVMAIDAKGCTSSSNTIHFTPCSQLFTISAGPDHVVCEGTAVSLNTTSTGSGSCTWNAPAGLSNYNICNPIYNGAFPGVHLFVVSDTLMGCRLSDSVYITVNPLPAQPTITWNGDSLISSAAIGNQWYSGGAAIPGETGQIFLPSLGGYYLVIVTSVAGCQSSSDSVLYVPCSQLVSIQTNADTSVCAGSPVQLNVTGNGSGNCIWNGPAGLSSYTICNPVFTSATFGDYQFIVTDNLNGCFASDTVNIHVDDVPPTPLITQHGDTLFSDSPTGNQWYFNSGILAGEIFPTLVTSQYGTYTLIVTDLKGCQSSSAPYTFTPCSQVISIQASNDTSICEGTPLNLSVTGNGSGHCIWSGPSGLDNYNTCSPVFTPGSHGDFMFTVTDTLMGCLDEDTVFIHVDSLPDQPVITISGDTLFAPAATSYQWYTSGNAIPGETFRFLIAIPNIYYYVTVINAAGCQATSDSVFYSPCIPPYYISTVNDTSICIGNTVALTTTGNGPGNCYWTGPAGLNNYFTCSPVFSGTTAGDFTFIVNDTIAGCSASDTVTIHVDNLPLQPVISLSTDTFYSSPENAYQWYTSGGLISGETNQFFLPTTGNWYYVIVTNAGGCSAISDSVLYSPCSTSFYIQTISDTNICSGTGIILATSGNGSGNCTWTGPAGLDDYNSCNPLFTSSSPGDFTFIVTDSLGSCLAGDTVIIHVDSLPSQPLVTLSGDTLYSTPAPSYQWYTSGNTIPGETNQFLIPSPGNWYYIVTTTAAGCSAMADSVYYGYCNQPFSISTNGDTAICAGSILNITTTGGPGNCTWNGPAGLDNYSGCNPTFSSTNPGDYTYIVTDTLMGCSSSDTIVIHVDGIPQPLITQSGDSLYSTAAISYQWYAAGNPLSGETNQYLVPSAPYIYYYALVTNAAGCSAITDSIYFIPCSLAVSITTIPDTTICAGAPVTLITTGNGNGNCVWSGPAGLDNYNTCQPVFITPFAGDYFYLVYDEYNTCLGFDSVTIHVINAPVKPVIAQHQDSLVTETGPYYFQWYYGGIPIPGENTWFMMPWQNGYYSVIITDLNGCNAISDSVAPGFTGISEGSSSGNLGLQYVNGSEFISIINNGNKTEKVTVRLYDITSKEILHQENVIYPGTQVKLVPGNIRPGIYIVYAESNGKFIRKKIAFSKY